MRFRATLSGLTAVLLVVVFYMFSFLLVEEVSDGEIPAEYRYIANTETKFAEMETLNQKQQEVFELGYFEPSGGGLDSRGSDESTTVLFTQAPSLLYTEEVHENTAFDNAMASEFTAALPLGLTEQTESSELHHEGSFEAEAQAVLASDAPQVSLLISRAEAEAFDSAVVTVVPEDLSKIPSVPVPDIVVAFTEQGIVYKEHDTFTENEKLPVGGAKDEMLTARYNGAVHTVDGFELICAITSRELSDSFSDEAIKAQAVAAYSYIKYHNINGLTPSVLVDFNYSPRIRDLVESVFGVGCYYDGKFAQTVYMASSAGFTASSENVWGSNVSYLTSVECPFDVKDSNYGVSVTYSQNEVKTALETALKIKLSDNPENWIKVMSHVDGNYVAAVNIDGQTTITGRKMREQVMGFKLKSASFSVEFNNGNFTFTTYGYGHGVGMSQNGANLLAKQGSSYVDILKFYFKGIEVY
ncbi:MAG: SpoIID/LytB domain-containing protein [Oscillospiraceae bacterium]|nr:SpoIID/LytB domain-containing protein [Oscillospiraceae bacterium]